MERPVENRSKRNFVLQQGLDDPPAAACSAQFAALHFQPRAVGAFVVVAAVLQSAVLYVALGAVLWFSALFPRANPFDAVYNHTLARRQGRRELAPAPAPRRFSQGLGGTFAVAAGTCLLAGWHLAALIVQALFVVAIGALVFGRFCLGSFVYHLLGGRRDFARRTVPWGRGA